MKPIAPLAGLVALALSAALIAPALADPRHRQENGEGRGGGRFEAPGQYGQPQGGPGGPWRGREDNGRPGAPYGGPPYGPGGRWNGGGRYAPPPNGPLNAEPQGRENSLGGGWREQQDEARAGVRSGELRPLGGVLAELRRRQPGRQLDAGIEEGPDGRPVYRVRWAAQNGRRIDFIVDARTGAILSEEGR
jgi:hypothetical protein